MTGDELSERLRQLLEELDSSVQPTSERDIAAVIRALGTVDSEAEVPFEAAAELLAFSFCENCNDKGNPRGTYFGTRFISTDDTGEAYESPFADPVDGATVDYWLNRGKQCKNPLLKARYLGLVWDLARHVTGDAPSHTIARDYIESLLKIVERDLHKSAVSSRFKLGRALSVATLLNDAGLVSACKSAIIGYETRVASDDKPGLWGFSFDLLWKNKKACLTEAEMRMIVGGLESRLERLCNDTHGKPPDPWNAEPAAKRLAQYYRAEDRPVEVRRVLQRLK